MSADPLRSRFLLCLCAALLGACAISPDAGFDDHRAAVEIAATPFYPQERYQCGPAALLTLLDYSGAKTRLDDLVQAVYLPGRQGSLQAEIIAATRAAGRIPYRVGPSLADVSAQLAADSPVLVLQNLGVSWYPRWHYAVIYAVDPEAGVVRLRSGTERNRTTRANTFLRTWQRGDFWGLVTLRPGQLPANPDPGRYFDAVAGMEETGHLAEAKTSWLAAHRHWPDEDLPLFGLANTEMALGEPEAAERHYRHLLQRSPGHVRARNNYAYALARQGKREEAIAELEIALAAPEIDQAMRLELEDSLREIRH